MTPFGPFIEALYREMMEPLDIEAVPRFLAPEYRQTTDGKTIDLDGFLRHLRELRTRFDSIEVLPFEEMIVEGDRAALLYRVRAHAKDGGQDVSGEMLAMWWREGDRIVRCVEMSRDDRTGAASADASAGA